MRAIGGLRYIRQPKSNPVTKNTGESNQERSPIQMEAWSFFFQTYLEWADLDALMVHSLYEIKEEKRRLEVLIEHLRILDTSNTYEPNTYSLLRYRLNDFLKSQVAWIGEHKKNELNIWGSDFDSRIGYFMARERLGAKDARWIRELEVREDVLKFLEWILPSTEAAWKVIVRRKGEESWRSRKPSGAEPTNAAVQEIYERGNSLYGEGKFAEALDHVRDSAEYGHPPSQNALGYLYYSGRGCALDYTKAVELYRRAANQEELKAWWNLFQVYCSGTGVAKDPALALRYLHAAALRGFSPAQTEVGSRFSIGQPNGFDLKDPYPQQDHGKAISWFRLGAEQGDAAAKECLARAYEDGLGVPKDAREAEAWKSKAQEYDSMGTEYFLIWESR